MSKVGILFALLACVACGGRLLDESSSSTDAASDAAVCAASTPACQLPDLDAAVGACTACVGAAICQCGNLNPPLDWAPPATCESGDGVCMSTASPSLPAQAACQVGAVQMASCLAAHAHSDCSDLYFAAHPGSVEPLGMEIALFDCAACEACAEPCRNSPNAPSFCSGLSAPLR
jgi:hypothetical protein